MTSTARSRSFVVLKFGGTSVATATRWRTILDEARRRADDGLRPVVVCSAVTKMTDALERTLKEAVVGDDAWRASVAAIRARHAALADELGVDIDVAKDDLDEVERLAHEHKPKMLVAGASAYPRIIDFERMSAIAKAVGAFFFVDMAHIAGLVAAGKHPSPVPHADFVTTTTHKTLRGPRGGLILTKAEHQKVIDSRVFPGAQGGPLMHAVAAKAVMFAEALLPSFVDYQQRVVDNAAALAKCLTSRGYNLTTGGTDNHLMLLDLRGKTVTGKVGEDALGAADITVNKNMIPYDPAPPMVSSGIRVGTPAVTTRGLTVADMDVVADCIARVLEAPTDVGVIDSVKKTVHALTARYPLYADLLRRLD